MHWGSRVGHYWFKKIKAQCEAEGNCHVSRVACGGLPRGLCGVVVRAGIVAQGFGVREGA